MKQVILFLAILSTLNWGLALDENVQSRASIPNIGSISIASVNFSNIADLSEIKLVFYNSSGDEIHTRTGDGAIALTDIDMWSSISLESLGNYYSFENKFEVTFSNGYSIVQDNSLDKWIYLDDSNTEIWSVPISDYKTFPTRLTFFPYLDRDGVHRQVGVTVNEEALAILQPGQLAAPENPNNSVYDYKTHKDWSNYFPIAAGDQLDFLIKHRFYYSENGTRLYYNLFLYAEKNGDYLTWEGSGGESNHFDIASYEANTSGEWEYFQESKNLDDTWRHNDHDIDALITGNNIKWARIATTFHIPGSLPDRLGLADIGYVVVAEADQNMSHDHIGESVSFVSAIGKPLQSVSRLMDDIYYSGNFYDDEGEAIGSSLPVQYRDDRQLVFRQDLLGQYTHDAENLLQLDASSKLHNYYNSEVEAKMQTPRPYSEVELDKGPIVRQKRSGSPGQPWSLHGDYYGEKPYPRLNQAVDGDIRMNADATPYDLNKLHCERSKSRIDETKSVETESWVDWQGLALKEVTRIVYDDGSPSEERVTINHYDERGNLTRSFPPSSFDPDGTFERVSEYFYNDKSQLLAKKIPDHDKPSLFVYDRFGVVVLSADPLSYADSPDDDIPHLPDGPGHQYEYNGNNVTTRWAGAFADKQGRTVISGELIEPASGAMDRHDLQDHFEAITWRGYLQKNGAAFDLSPLLPAGYSDFLIRGTSHYDDYDFDADGSADLTPPAGLDHSHNRLTHSISYLEMPPVDGSTRTVISDDTYMEEIYFYDFYGFMREKRQKLVIAGAEVYDKTFKYNFDVYSGRLLDDQYSMDSDRFKTWYEYDAAGRLHRMYNANSLQKPATADVENLEYDHLGNLTLSKIHDKFELHKSYDFLGRLKNIHFKEPDDLGKMVTLFEEELYYDDHPEVAKKRFDGNITRARFNTKGTHADDHWYDYDYDNWGQLAQADYHDAGVSSDKFDVRNFAYDFDGNILGLQRYGETGSLIDDFAYSYANGQQNNRLSRLTDRVTGTKERSNSADIQYDINGNMLSDDSKDIVNIVYNGLNLPVLIELTGNRWIRYWYDGGGNRIFKQQSGGDGQLYILDGGATRAVYEIDQNGSTFNLGALLFWPLPGVGGKMLPMIPAAPGTEEPQMIPY
jgi:hypothetical protein